MAFRPFSGPGGLPVPPDPAAFAGDPRLAACFAAAGEVQAAFEMRHARDYQRHLPRMLRSPELEVDDPGFVVVFAGDVPLVGVSRLSGPGKVVCILVGDTPNLYDDVDISGLRATVPGSRAMTRVQPAPTARPRPPRPPPARPSSPPGLGRRSRGPARMRRTARGHWPGSARRPRARWIPARHRRSAQYLLTVGCTPGCRRAVSRPPQVEGPWALHRYLVDGRLKVIVVQYQQIPRYPRRCRLGGRRAARVRPGRVRSSRRSDRRRPRCGSMPMASASGPIRIFSRPGPGHCGWEDVVFLHFEDGLYLRDLDGVLADRPLGAFRTVDALPADAVDTGLHTADLATVHRPGRALRRTFARATRPSSAGRAATTTSAACSASPVCLRRHALRSPSELPRDHRAARRADELVGDAPTALRAPRRRSARRVWCGA